MKNHVPVSILSAAMAALLLAAGCANTEPTPSGSAPTPTTAAAPELVFGQGIGPSNGQVISPKGHGDKAPVTTEASTTATVPILSSSKLFSGLGENPFRKDTEDEWSPYLSGATLYRTQAKFSAGTKTVTLELYLPKGWTIRGKGSFAGGISAEGGRYLFNDKGDCVGRVVAGTYAAVDGKKDQTAAYAALRGTEKNGLLDADDYLPMKGRHTDTGRGHNAIAPVAADGRTNVALLTFDPVLMQYGAVELLPDALTLTEQIRLAQSMVAVDPSGYAGDDPADPTRDWLGDWTSKRWFAEKAQEVWTGTAPQLTLYRTRTRSTDRLYSTDLEVYLPQGWSIRDEGDVLTSIPWSPTKYLYDAKGACVGTLYAGGYLQGEGCATYDDPQFAYAGFRLSAHLGVLDGDCYLPVKGRRRSGHNALSLSFFEDMSKEERPVQYYSVLMTYAPTQRAIGAMDILPGTLDSLTLIRIAQSMMVTAS